MSESIPGVRVVPVHKRDALHRDDRVPDAEIAICQRLPTDLESLVETYAADGRQIADLLWDSLPGGTVDVLIIELMQRRASLMRVGFMTVDEISWMVEGRRDDRRPRWSKGRRVELAESLCEREPDMRGQGGTVLAVTQGALDTCQVLFDGETKSRIVPETYLVEHRRVGDGPGLVG